jgi:hypothetical protein
MPKFVGLMFGLIAVIALGVKGYPALNNNSLIPHHHHAYIYFGSSDWLRR